MSRLKKKWRNTDEVSDNRHNVADISLFCELERQSAEANVSNFKYDFRKNDPDGRLRVQAIIEKIRDEAKQKIDKKEFAKHLANSHKEQRNIVDSKRAKESNNQRVREEFYKRRD